MYRVVIRKHSMSITTLLDVSEEKIQKVCSEGFVRIDGEYIKGQCYYATTIDCSRCDFPGCELGLSMVRRWRPALEHGGKPFELG
jgi:hypothetical protein